MPTPTGPVPRDPNDPDLWDWDLDSDDVDRQPRAGRRPRLRSVVAAILVGLLVVLILASVL